MNRNPEQFPTYKFLCPVQTTQTSAYFAASSGNVTDEVVMKYIEQQGHEPPDGDFKIEGDP
jgi:hypothetical protein